MKGPRGFTLLEVTVSVTIICILAAILFPVFARAREKARQTRCLTNLQQIGLALSMYARDHAGHFPPTNDDLTPLLGRYLPDAEVLRCPSRHDESRRRASEPGTAQQWKTPTVDYFYRAGFCDDDDPNTLLVCDSEVQRHNDGGNTLWTDGHGKWLSSPAYTAPPGSGVDLWEPIIKERKEYVPQPSPTPAMPGAPKGGGPP
ncbi:MAG: type II secretion system protein [Armatimonadetes bacterium]|nr:type II secretion system protein [Armatimonadota bacterium]